MFFLYVKVFLQWAWLALLLALVALLNGCAASLTPELIQALSKDQASICIQTDVRGGAGLIAGAPSGGYGQATGSLCRSAMPGATIELKPDGSISIKHEAAPTTMIFDPSQFNFLPTPHPEAKKNDFILLW